MTRTNLGVLVHNRILKRLTLMAAMRQRVNVTTASIPGPPMTLYLAGCRILEVFPLVPLMADEPLGVGAVSYAGDLNIGVVADRDAIPDIDVLAAGIRNEFPVSEDKMFYRASNDRVGSGRIRDRVVAIGLEGYGVGMARPRPDSSIRSRPAPVRRCDSSQR